MRLDRFLKISTIIKRRTLANEACDAGRVSINDKPAKASTPIAVNDIIEIRFGQSSQRVRVLDIKEHVTKEGAASLYEIL